MALFFFYTVCYVIHLFFVFFFAVVHSLTFTVVH